MILGIDPGPEKSGFAILDGETVVSSGVLDNWSELDDSMLRVVGRWTAQDRGPVAIEMIASYGMPVGADVFRTCVWIGRFLQLNGGCATLIPRLDVKIHLCHSPKAKDANVRQSLIDRLGPPGTVKAKGPTWGVKSHAWAALAVAVTARDQLEGKNA